ncbi:MAG: 2-hydroxyacid dehydrogenase [Alphaproteobacteria bacterium]|nr:2-hydroxyacid dehydrogenase [Alphaproteobacteria bacterium]
MAKTSILIVEELTQAVMTALEQAYETHRYWEAPDKDMLLSAISDRVRGIATTGHAGASESLIQALPNLEIISCYGVGVDAVDLPAAARAGVIVTNTPDVLTDDVANLAVGFVLAVSRDLVQGDAHARSGAWERDGNMHLTRSIRGKKAGIVGLGRIGMDIAKKLEIFELEIHWHGPRAKPGAPYPYHPDLTEMAAAVDYLLVACPGGAATRHIVNGAVLAALGPEGSLINISRGSCVDEAALVAAVETGTIGWAGLDVFEDEPRIPEALKQSDRVTLQPHAGSATVETRAAMGALVVENLALHFAGKPVRTPVT